MIENTTEESLSCTISAFKKDSSFHSQTIKFRMKPLIWVLVSPAGVINLSN